MWLLCCDMTNVVVFFFTSVWISIAFWHNLLKILKIYIILINFNLANTYVLIKHTTYLWNDLNYTRFSNIYNNSIKMIIFSLTRINNNTDQLMANVLSVFNNPVIKWIPNTSCYKYKKKQFQKEKLTVSMYLKNVFFNTVHPLTEKNRTAI